MCGGIHDFNVIVDEIAKGNKLWNSSGVQFAR
jgi:hypothetical protein